MCFVSSGMWANECTTNISTKSTHLEIITALKCIDEKTAKGGQSAPKSENVDQGPAGGLVNIQSGKWAFHNKNKETGAREWTKYIKFARKFDAKPVVVLGLEHVDFQTYDDSARSNGIKVEVDQSSITNEGFLLRASQWMGENYRFTVNWIAYSN